MTRTSIVLVLFSGFVLYSCSKTTEPQTQSSYQLLQQKVFDVSCTQCHNDTRKSISGNLSLTGDGAYTALVGATPANEHAAMLGLLRVKAGDADHSFLMKKITGDLDSLMGDPMPQSAPKLSVNKIEFIRQWIAAGAPKEGVVADASLLNDESAGQKALVQPAAPSADKGFQLHLLPFSVPPGSEREIFVYKEPVTTSGSYIKSLDIHMREGSHHFVLWNLNGGTEGVADDQVRDRTDGEMNRLTRSFIFGAQTPDAQYTFPDGVALPIDPSKGFDLNSHYVNTTDQTYFGEAYINVWTVSPAEVKHIAHPFIQADFDPSFVIPKHGTAVRRMPWNTVTDTSHLFLLTSHAHARMQTFDVYVRRQNGQMTKIYTSDDWHEPVTTQLDLVLYPGDYLYSETTYKNDTDHDIRFGYTSQDEMNVILGYYW
jgi:hypothetical protein